MRPRLALSFLLAFVAACGSSSTTPKKMMPPPPPPPPPPSVPLAQGSPWPKFRANAAQDARSAVMPKQTGGTFWDYKTPLPVL
jgi:hypothetical protein